MASRFALLKEPSTKPQETCGIVHRPRKIGSGGQTDPLIRLQSCARPYGRLTPGCSQQSLPAVACHSQLSHREVGVTLVNTKRTSFTKGSLGSDSGVLFPGSLDGHLLITIVRPGDAHAVPEPNEERLLGES